MEQINPNLSRSIGVLLHPTALPGNSVCGNFGSAARTWLKLLARNGIGVWQLLPLAPTDSTGSPYSSPSSFALNPWFLDVNDLVDEGVLPSQALLEVPVSGRENLSSVDFKLADLRSEWIGHSLRENWACQSSQLHDSFDLWCNQQFWLEDYVLFVELRRQHQNLPWWKWPEQLAVHNQSTLTEWTANHQNALLEHRLLQWHLDRQWQALRGLSRELGIIIFGDLPFYVSKDSADVWSNRELFSIQPSGVLDIQSGVPPDYFSTTGQLWGTPVYRWKYHQETKFEWWRSRIARQWELFDLLRLDHFRALDSYWAVSGNKETAQEGDWKPSPGEDLLKLLRKDCEGNLPLVAEDLGLITPEVHALREKFCLPGMKILQFAFDGDPENPYLPENIIGPNWVVYTGTHDNPTTLGWWEALDVETKESVLEKFNDYAHSPVWKLIDIGLATEAFLVIAPVQDLLCLNDYARFNTPGTVGNNWVWRLSDFDSCLDSVLRRYGERGRFWGRTSDLSFGLI